MTVVTTLKNGVDVQKLTGLIEEVKREPWKARVEFTVKSEWKGGFQAKHTVGPYTVGDTAAEHERPHTLTSDEPTAILGKDGGFSPSELVLSALASCMSVGYAANAAAMGIDLQEVRFEITGKGDLQGFMALNDVRPGMPEISVKTFVKSNATPEQLKALHDHVYQHSPIRDTLSNPVKVTSELVTG
jgi:uncharacterized OsmC-like protein